jgi:hypothetical protein
MTESANRTTSHKCPRRPQYKHIFSPKHCRFLWRWWLRQHRSHGTDLLSPFQGRTGGCIRRHRRNLVFLRLSPVGHGPQYHQAGFTRVRSLKNTSPLLYVVTTFSSGHSCPCTPRKHKQKQGQGEHTVQPVSAAVFTPGTSRWIHNHGREGGKEEGGTV